MKPNLEKLYEKSPPASLATLATGAFLRSDTDELHRIVSAIGGRQAGAQLQYSHHQHALTTTTLLWALDVQRTYSSALEFAVGAALVPPLSKEWKAFEFLRRAMQIRLSSLAEAMRTICADSGLDFADVEKASGLSSMPLRDDVPALPAIVTELVEQYRTSAAH